MRVLYSPLFLRSFKKLPSEIQKVFRKREIVFRRNAFDPSLGTHKLKGRDDWSFLITYHVRVIFIFHEDHALLINIGDHSIYRRRR